MATVTNPIHRIAIIGYRGTGKTTVGKLLAQDTGWRFIDMDEVLTHRFKMTIHQWVDRFGWESFRKEESQLLTELLSAHHTIISTGGGVVESATNRQLLRQHFTVVWLYCTIEKIAARIENDTASAALRPPLTGQGTIEEIRTVVNYRTPFYAETATIRVDTTDATPEEVCRRISSLIAP